jgi:curved DNA-binding protein CbpA
MSEEAPGAGFTKAPSGLDADPLAEDVDIDRDVRRRVLALHRELANLDHYALLGIDPAADRKSIKRAYFELAAVFHPDKYFRKRLGSFKGRMEAVFSQATLAHDILVTKESRAEYDTYLAEQRRVRGMEALLSSAAAETRRAEESIEREVQADEGANPAPPAPAPRAPSPKVDAAARREALARRLLGGRHPNAPAGRTGDAAAKAPSPMPLTPEEAVAALRRRYEDRIAQAKLAQARRYAARADEALAGGDTVAAANALRVASGLAPSDTAIKARAAEAQVKADALLASTYMSQAQYEEKNGQWAQAARSWARAAPARPDDAATHERAANAIVKASGDLHEAQRFARRACELAPSVALYRVTLATVYLAAGLELNARRELEAAAQLAPDDATIRTMLEKLGSST